MIGNNSSKRAARLALAATRSNIERTIAPPTLEQARIMGVESVVEGVDWKLSTEQLEVLALARSGALRGRRRVPPRALPQPSLATPETTASASPTAPKHRVAKAQPRKGRTNPRKSESSVERACTGDEEQGLGISTQRSSARRGSDKVPKRHPPAAEASTPTKQGAKSSTTMSLGAACAPTSFPAVSKRQRHQLEVVEETQEQLVAVARGGIRYAGKVFHRRGVQLTEDSPRSMIPRDAFREEGLHLLGRKDLSMGRDGHRRLLVAELSAVVRAIPVDSEKELGSPEDTAACMRCHDRDKPVVFSQDFTHTELDALLGPTLSWEDPFEENRKTVGGLGASWTACLDSLCGRLRATVPEAGVRGEGTNGDRPQREEEGMNSPGGACGSGAVVAGTRGIFPGSTDGSRGNAEAPQPRQCIEKGGLRASTDDEREGSPLVPVAAGNAAKAGHPAGLAAAAAAAGDGETPGRVAQTLPLVRRRKAGGELDEDAGGGVWFDKTILRVGARVPWGRLHRGRFAKVLFTVSMGESGSGLEFAATSISPTADPMLRGIWDFRANDRDIARYLSSGHAAANGAGRRVRPHAYDPRRCVAELQERGELERACTVIARTAFRLVLVVPGGVVLSLAGVAIVGGREVAWPQDIAEDRMLYKASTGIQRAWRGCAGRKRTRWLRMEREGRRRLSRMRKEAEDERERMRLLEEEAKAKLALEEERRTRAQIVLAAATRGQAAKREYSRRRAEETARQCQLALEAAVEREEAEKVAAAAGAAAVAAAAAAYSSPSRGDEGSGEADETAASEPGVDDHHGGSAAPGVARLESVVTIDGSEVHLTAHVSQADVDGAGGDNYQPTEMVLVAVDKKARRSSTLSLDAADIREIVGAHESGDKDGGGVKKGAQGALAAVLQKLTLFNSRRKDLFILSYRGKKVVAPH
eukprot:g18352.t2